MKPKFPDFKRKDGGHALWLNKIPRLVLKKLETVELDRPVSKFKQFKQQKGRGTLLVIMFQCHAGLSKDVATCIHIYGHNHINHFHVFYHFICLRTQHAEFVSVR